MACENCRSIELCTSQQLIDELVSRPTFLGFVLHAQSKGEPVTNFSLTYAGMTPEDTIRMLETAIDWIKQHV